MYPFPFLLIVRIQHKIIEWELTNRQIVINLQNWIKGEYFDVNIFM